MCEHFFFDFFFCNYFEFFFITATETLNCSLNNYKFSFSYRKINMW